MIQNDSDDSVEDSAVFEITRIKRFIDWAELLVENFRPYTLGSELQTL